MSDVLSIVLVGLVAGWLAGTILKRRGFGIVGNLVVGIVGAVLGGALFKFAGLSSHGTMGNIIMATIGAVVVLSVVNMVNRLSSR